MGSSRSLFTRTNRTQSILIALEVLYLCYKYLFHEDDEVEDFNCYVPPEIEHPFSVDQLDVERERYRDSSAGSDHE